jgi:chorismate synthase
MNLVTQIMHTVIRNMVSGFIGGGRSSVQETVSRVVAGAIAKHASQK